MSLSGLSNDRSKILPLSAGSDSNEAETVDFGFLNK
jgi:hypothetical protein